MLAGRPRIPLPGPETMTPDQKRVFDSVVSGPRGTLIGPLRAALHNPVLADRWSKFGETLRYNTTFPAQLSELAVLVTARRWNSELEWVIHEKAARAADLPADVIDAIREGREPGFAEEAQREVYDYVSALQNYGQVTDELHEAITRRWGVVGVVELTALTGYYSMVAMTLNAHRIPLPDGASPDLHDDRSPLPTELRPLPLSGEAVGPR